MRVWTWALLWASLIGVPAGAVAADDDEAWIEQYMAERHPQARTPAGHPQPASRDIAVGALASYVGRDVKLVLVGGETRRGTVEGIRNGKLSLKAKMYGGMARITIPLDRINRAERG
ncbi:MAG: hypothetical protein U1F26_05065 [Lysobacterales bacterium]